MLLNFINFSKLIDFLDISTILWHFSQMRHVFRGRFSQMRHVLNMLFSHLRQFM
ncbi:hypothetical protein HMPREF1584_00681 [Gardnerella vaginalis JCP8481A]|nr:hypothetical protein HMPREF1584_00681 [Gardnerella vaginalis JCP8481A]EPI43622.1 hypothetical protein HMPREF1585_00436 [Gardnerella vaginalis JCP8481B]